MNVLICGATGFVGSAIMEVLLQKGHTCIGGVRRPTEANHIAVDYLDATELGYWSKRLDGIDVVVNAVGVLRDTAKTPMKLLHHEAPAALFKACEETGVKRIINISALGVDSGLATVYFQTKKAAEDTLFSLSDKVNWLNLRPSLVYGENGASAKMFRLQASLPGHFLPMGGMQEMQPVHIRDLATAVANWIAQPDAENLRMNVVGSEVVTMRSMLDSYRSQQDKGKALHIPVPGLFVRMAAAVGDYIPVSPLCRETLAMLELGNTGDGNAFTELLGRQAMGVSTFIKGIDGEDRE
ncbi:MAG: NAD-dependent epimerase/dehydratase family protein [Pseudomonadales bacterium]|nr:NAD-dependent epimerase/dehydratase family protein [Pseudomonadales bacterium]